MNGHYSEKVHKWPIRTLRDAPTGNANQNRNDDYAIYTNTESLHPTSETTITLHVNYISIKKKTTLRYHFIPTKMSRIKKMDDNISWDGEKLEPSHTAGVNVKRCGCFGKQSGSPSKENTGGITM